MVVDVIADPRRARENARGRELPPMEVASRIGRLRERLEEEHLGGLIVTSMSNVRYLSGFSGSTAMLLITSSRVVFLTDGRYKDQSAAQLEQAGVDADVVVGKNAEQMKALERGTSSLKQVGLESEDATWAFATQLSKELKPETKPTSKLVEALRVVKDAGEIARIERACDIADIAFAQTKERMKSGITEAEFAAELDFEMRKRGAESVSFATIVGSGPNAALPHSQPSNRAIGEGELVVIDFGATFDGYHSDMTRTVCIGEPEGVAAAVLDAVAASQRAGMLAVKAGVVAGDVDRACRDSLAEAGYAEAFTHSTGHGVGLEVHEAPSVAHQSEDVLEKNTVITVEPGVYLPGETGARIEDTVVVTSSGCRPLTKTTKDAVI
ncbi:MAG: Xaa-Pro peptidase family protein [Acidimicrobiales bacterium]